MKKFSTFLFSFVPFLIGFGIQYFIVIYFAILAAIFMLGVGPILSGTNYSSDDLMTLFADMNFNTIVMIAFSVSCIATFGIWYYKSCGGNYRFSMKKDFHPLQLGGLLIMLPGTQFATSLLMSILTVIFPKWWEEYQALMEANGLDGEVPVLMMIYSVCLAPISEELIFRGVTMRIARRAFPFWAANIIQAVLFGVFHMNWLQGCYAFALGLILGYICERGGSIYYSILFHFLFNLWGTTSQWLNSVNEYVLSAIILGSTFIVLPLGFLMFRQGIIKKKETIPTAI
ncbi:MAG: CPBP family intramembrane metalloprotease [Agathobacter sp.]|nr:CPBP family intramembrane metalloprotease [Agathobacter sp.]